MTKNKDKKGKESTIGKIIYGFLLLMPLLAIGVTCLYAIRNENAYQSYRTEDTEIQYSQVTSLTQFSSGNDYLINLERFYNATQPISTSPTIEFSYSTDGVFDIFSIQNVNKFYLKRETSGLRMYVFNANGQTNDRQVYSSTNNIWYSATSVVITLTSIDTTNGSTIDNAFSEIIQLPPSINNVFYTAVNKVEESNLFNWAKNSIVYTTLVTTCNALSITNTFIPMLLTYWLIISVIYILYDIALMMIIIFHHKVHCLQDSI